MPRKDDASDFIVVSIDADAVAIHDIDVRVIAEELGHIGQRSRQQHVVAVEPGHDIAVDSAETKVDRMRLSVVALAYPGEPAVELSQDAAGIVGRAAILRGVPQCRVILSEHRSDRAFDICSLVEAWRHDRDTGRVTRQSRREVPWRDTPCPGWVLIERM